MRTFFLSVAAVAAGLAIVSAGQAQEPSRLVTFGAPEPTGTPLPAGETMRGTVDWDDPMRDGKCYDAYRFEGEEGQNVILEMRGLAFDPYLILFRADDMTNPIAEDDDGGDAVDARIALALPETGAYVVYATSSYLDAIGTYGLNLYFAASVDEIPGVNDEIVYEGINFGRDTSRWSHDGECDDPRFEGPGMASGQQSAEDSSADATDCYDLYRTGEVTLR